MWNFNTIIVDIIDIQEVVFCHAAIVSFFVTNGNVTNDDLLVFF